MKQIIITILFFYGIQTTSVPPTYTITNVPHSTTYLCLNTPPAFGKTHFIRGYHHSSSQMQQAEKQQQQTRIGAYAQLDFGRERLCDAFFSPDDDVRSILISLIEQEQVSICIAIYSFTDRMIAKALDQARQRGVAIDIVVDPSCLYDRYSKIDQLLKDNITILIYNPKSRKNNGAKRASGLMHNKFALFGKNNGEKSILWTGSFNFTRSGHLYNQENIIILDDQLVVKKYMQRFEHIKKQSYVYRSPIRHG